MMAMPTPFQVINPSVQNTMSNNHLHTPQSMFQHMMAQSNAPHEPGSWTQIPQVPPMCIPWSVSNLQHPHIVKFTGENKIPPLDSMLHQKRKLDITDSASQRPAKQFISEERMAAHFSDMHISSNHTGTRVPSTSQTSYSKPSSGSFAEINLNTNSGELEDGKSMHPRLVISEELKRLQQEPLLPASLLSKLERPSMALVLWEPPSKHLRIFPTRSDSHLQTPRADVDGDNDSNNNNNAQVGDLNQSEHGPHNAEFEPMDL